MSYRIFANVWFRLFYKTASLFSEDTSKINKALHLEAFPDIKFELTFHSLLYLIIVLYFQQELHFKVSYILGYGKELSNSESLSVVIHEFNHKDTEKKERTMAYFKNTMMWVEQIKFLLMKKIKRKMLKWINAFLFAQMEFNLKSIPSASSI